jgi:transcription initiation factor TFIIH subunit 2
MNIEAEEQEGEKYNWEGDIGKAWAGLMTDHTLSALIKDDTMRKLEKKNYMDKMNSSAETRSMIRYLTIIIDLSKSMKNTDMKPTRLAVTKVHLKKFIEDFFDQNPLSLISLQSTSD